MAGKKRKAKAGPVIYIASPWSIRKQTKVLARKLEAAGATINSSWLTEEAGRLNEKQAALRDLSEIAAADWLVLFTPDALPIRGGCMIEMGYALALGKPVYRVGKWLTIFDSMAKFVTETELVRLIEEYNDGHKKEKRSL